jgi:segregation and condensation protein B
MERLKEGASAQETTNPSIVFLNLSPFEQLKRHVEAVLFAAEGLMDLSEIRTCLGEVAREDVRMVLKDLSKEYEGRSFFLFETGGRYQLRTRPEHAEIVSKQFHAKPRSLSKAAIETLAIIAYRQPTTRAEINAIRGTDSSSIVASLKDKDLIAVGGQRKEVGSPLEFRTTSKFLEVFGLATLKDLPTLRSLQMNTEDQKQVAATLAELSGQTQEIPLDAADLALVEPEHLQESPDSLAF